MKEGTQMIKIYRPLWGRVYFGDKLTGEGDGDVSSPMGNMDCDLNG